jgi:peroxiredoxin
MRKLISVLLAAVVFQSCNQTNDHYTIRLDLEGTEGRWVKLTGRMNREYVVMDSVLIESGVEAIMSQPIEGVKTRYLSVDGQQGSIRLLLENAEYTISGSMDDPVIETTGQAQRDLNGYNELTGFTEDKLASLADAYYGALEQEDQDAADSILEAYNMVNAEKEVIDSLYLAENPGSYATVLVLRGSFYMLDTDELEEILNSLDPALRQMEEFGYMYGIMEHQKEVAVGKPYKDFGLATPDGEILKVSDVHHGNVLLIDFWASWCGPCRRANPELVRMYDEFHGRGLEILGVSLDTDRTSWLKAIAEDNLSWYQISDVKGWECEGSRLYGVPAIPHSVLIDRDGIIKAKKLQGKALQEAIASLL